MFARYSAAGFVKNKKPETIIRATMYLFNNGPFEPPRKYLADNCGEFTNEKYRDMCENLNVKVLKTGAASPFQTDCVKKITP